MLEVLFRSLSQETLLSRAVPAPASQDTRSSDTHSPYTHRQCDTGCDGEHWDNGSLEEMLKVPVSCCHYNMKGLQNLHEAMGNGCSPGMVVFMFRATRHPAAPNQTFVHSVACKDGVPPLKGRAEWFISVRAGTEERLGHRI